MHRAQTIAFDGRSNGAHQRRCNQERGPETDPAADLKSEERAEHVEAGVGKIQDAEHTEDDGETARHQKQQHAVKHAVQRRYNDQFKHSGTPKLSQEDRRKTAPFVPISKCKVGTNVGYLTISSACPSCKWSEAWFAAC